MNLRNIGWVSLFLMGVLQCVGAYAGDLSVDNLTVETNLTVKGVIAGNGAGLTNVPGNAITDGLDASHITSGQLPAYVLPSSGIWNADGLIVSNALFFGNGAGLSGLMVSQINGLGSAATNSSADFIPAVTYHIPAYATNNPPSDYTTNWSETYTTNTMDAFDTNIIVVAGFDLFHWNESASQYRTHDYASEYVDPADGGIWQEYWWGTYKIYASDTAPTGSLTSVDFQYVTSNDSGEQGKYDWTGSRYQRSDGWYLDGSYVYDNADNFVVYTTSLESPSHAAGANSVSTFALPTITTNHPYTLTTNYPSYSTNWVNITNYDGAGNFYGNFSGTGSGLANLNAAQITFGQLTPAVLPSAEGMWNAGGLVVSNAVLVGNGAGLTGLTASQIVGLGSAALLNSNQLVTTASAVLAASANWNSPVAIGGFANGNSGGVAIGFHAIAPTWGVAVGSWGNGSDSGVAVGLYSDGHGVGNIAIGGGDHGNPDSGARIPDGWIDTTEIGRGQAQLQGGFNFRGHGIVNSNGVVVAPIATSSLSVQGTINGDGSGLTNIRGDAIAAGQLSAAVLPTGGVWNAGGMVLSNAVLMGVTTLTTDTNQVVISNSGFGQLDGTYTTSDGTNWYNGQSYGSSGTPAIWYQPDQYNFEYQLISPAQWVLGFQGGMDGDWIVATCPLESFPLGWTSASASYGRSYGIAQVPANWLETVELGSGMATLEGGLNFRGYGIMDGNGVVIAPINTTNLIITGQAIYIPAQGGLSMGAFTNQPAQ